MKLNIQFAARKAAMAITSENSAMATIGPAIGIRLTDVTDRRPYEECDYQRDDRGDALPGMYPRQGIVAIRDQTDDAPDNRQHIRQRRKHPAFIASSVFKSPLDSSGGI